MPVYTVHAPVTSGADVAATDRFAFVRDGFHFWAAVLGPVWLAWHRLWLALIGWIVLMAVIDVAMVRLGVGTGLSGSLLQHGKRLARFHRCHRIKLHPVARGKNHRLRHHGRVQQQSQYRRNPRLGKCKPFPHCDRCCSMTQADDDYGHEIRNYGVRTIT